MRGSAPSDHLDNFQILFCCSFWDNNNYSIKVSRLRLTNVTPATSWSEITETTGTYRERGKTRGTKMFADLNRERRRRSILLVSIGWHRTKKKNRPWGNKHVMHQCKYKCHFSRLCRTKTLQIKPRVQWLLSSINIHSRHMQSADSWLSDWENQRRWRNAHFWFHWTPTKH